MVGGNIFFDVLFHIRKLFFIASPIPVNGKNMSIFVFPLYATHLFNNVVEPGFRNLGFRALNLPGFSALLSLVLETSTTATKTGF